MKKRLLVLPMALLMVVMGASPALALGVRDLCVSQSGQTVYQTGPRTCFSDATSQAVAFNQSFADASNASQAVAIDGFAGANEHSQAVAIDRSFAVAQSYSQAVAIDRSFAGALNHSQAVSINRASAFAFDACTVVALNGEEVSC
jgi:hypothetical protein